MSRATSRKFRRDATGPRGVADPGFAKVSAFLPDPGAAVCAGCSDRIRATPEPDVRARRPQPAARRRRPDRLPALRPAAAPPGPRAGRVGALPALRQGAVAPPRGLAQPHARADARGGGALRGRELRSRCSASRPSGARPPPRCSAAPQQLWNDGQRDRRGAGALHRRRRAGAADRLHAGDRARRAGASARRAGSGRCCAITRPPAPGA